MKKQSQVLTGPPAQTERNPASFNRACPICGWESEETIEGTATKFAKCPKCGSDVDQPFIINTAPKELELLTPQVAKEKAMDKKSQAVQTSVDVNSLRKSLLDQGIDPTIADAATKLVEDQTKAKSTKQPQSGMKPIAPALKPVSTKLKILLNNKKAWGDEPTRTTFGPDYEPPRLAQADEETDVDLFHADEPEMTVEELKSLGERLGIDWSAVKFSPDDFLAGYKVELEHGARDKETNVTDDDPEKTAKIAWAHLKEDPKYYQKLKTIEENKHEIKAFMHRRAVTVRELQSEYLPRLEESLFNIQIAMQHADYAGAEEHLHEAFSTFTVVQDKVNSLGDVDPVVYGPADKEGEKTWFQKLFE